MHMRACVCAYGVVCLCMGCVCAYVCSGVHAYGLCVCAYGVLCVLMPLSGMKRDRGMCYGFC